MAKFIDWCANVLKKTWEIKFKIRKNDEENNKDWAEQQCSA